MLAPRFVADILSWLVDQPADLRDNFRLNSQVTLAALCLNEVRKRNEIPEADALVRSRLEAVMRDDRLIRFGSSMLSLIVRVWRNSPETPAWLKSRAQPPEGSELRAAALQELAAGWPGYPGTLELVQSAAQSDDFSRVRAAAITQLAQHWRNHAHTLPIIKFGAESDKEFDVRVAAINALSTGWKDDPETLSWLKNRIVLDPSSAVRQAILRNMAKEWFIDSGANSDRPWTPPVTASAFIKLSWDQLDLTPRLVTAGRRGILPRRKALVFLQCRGRRASERRFRARLA
jgi:hypothetical protein